MGLGIATVVDTVLASVLIYVLHNSRTGLKKSVRVLSGLCFVCGAGADLIALRFRTNSMLDTLIAYSVCTGTHSS